MINDFDVQKASYRFIEARTKAKKTQEQLAAELDINPQTIKNYEKAGSTNAQNSCNSRTNAIAGMKIETLYKAAKLLNVSADYLLGLSDVKSSNPDIKNAVELTGLSEEDIVALALANRISQSYIPSQPAKGIWPVESYNPPADASMTYQKFVEETNLLQFVCPMPQEYYNDIRIFDEMALDLLRNLPSFIDDLIHAAIQDWSIVSDYRTLCKSPYACKTDVKQLSKDHHFAVENGYALMEASEYFDFLTQKIGRSIAGYLSAKLNSPASNLGNIKNSHD